MLQWIRRDAWWRPVLVLVIMVVMARLGMWQLDRLEQRRARNAQIRAQMDAPPLDLNRDAIPEDIDAFKYRLIRARGQFDFDHQVALKNRSWQGRPGVDLITPLLLEGKEQAVLVDRGWVPYDKADPQSWATLDRPVGTLTVLGFVGLAGAPPPHVQRPITPDPADRSLFYVDPASLETLLPYPILPFYIVWMPEEGAASDDLPLRYSPPYDLSEGPHLGYAIQWFLFAAAAPLVYLYLLKQKNARGS